MPHLALDKEYCYVLPPLKEKSVKVSQYKPPAQWITQLAQLIYNNLSESTKQTTSVIDIKQRLNDHMGYDALRINLQQIYGIFSESITDDTINFDVKNDSLLLAEKLHEGLLNCGPGFTNRTNDILINWSMETNFAERLEKIRTAIVKRAASKLTNETHTQNRVTIVAARGGLGVRPINGQDPYSGYISYNTIANTLREAFKEQYTPCLIIKAIEEQLSSILVRKGYVGPKDPKAKSSEDATYTVVDYESWLDSLKMVFPKEVIDSSWLIVDEVNYYIVDINWLMIRQAILKKLVEDHFLEVEQDQEIALHLLPLSPDNINEFKYWVLNIAQTIDDVSKIPLDRFIQFLNSTENDTVRLITESMKKLHKDLQTHILNHWLALAVKGPIKNYAITLSYLAKNDFWPTIMSLIDSNPDYLYVLNEHGETLLHIAAQQNNVLVMEYLLKKDSETLYSEYRFSSLLNKKDNLKRTPLYTAVANGQDDSSLFLLSQPQIKLNTKALIKNQAYDYPYTALDQAILKEKHELAMALIKAGANINITSGKSNHSCIFRALKFGDVALVQEILHKKPDLVNDIRNNRASSPLMHLILFGETNRLELTKLLLEQPEINTSLLSTEKLNALDYALQKGYQDIIILLLEKNPEFLSQKTQDGDHLLLWAAKHGTLDLVQYLIKKNEEYELDLLNQGDRYGRTALYFAAANAHEEIVDYLLEQPEIDVNVTCSNVLLEPSVDCHGSTVLKAAISNNHTNIAIKLIKKIGVQRDFLMGKCQYNSIYLPVIHTNINAIEIITELLKIEPDLINEQCNTLKYTPLMYAIGTRNHPQQHEIIKYLLQQPGIDLTCRSIDNKTALDYALEIKDMVIVDLISKTLLEQQRSYFDEAENSDKSELPKEDELVSKDSIQIDLDIIPLDAKTILAHENSGELIFKKLILNDHISEKDLKTLSRHKEKAIEYIATLPVQQQKIAIIQALDSHSFLHDYFMVQRGFFTPRKGAGTLKTLEKMLVNLEANSAALKA